MRARFAASVVLAAGVLLASTGCGYLSPPATQISYSPSDGVMGRVGDVDIRNAMAFSEDGSDVNLVMVLLNNGDEDVTLNFQVNFSADADGERTTQTVQMPARTIISFGSAVDQPQFVFEGVGVELGGVMPLYVQYGDEPGTTLLVPVLDGTFERYEELLPTPVPTAVPTPTRTLVPGPEVGDD